MAARKKAVKKAVKKSGGLFGGAARGLMGRRARIEAAVSGRKAKKKTKRK